MKNHGTRQVAEHHGWPIQLLLGCSRAVNQRPRLQFLHRYITLLARHLKMTEGGAQIAKCSAKIAKVIHKALDAAKI